MSWMETIPTFVAAIAVIFLPGALTLVLGGARKFSVLALAAPITLSYAGIFAIIFGLLHIPFHLYTFFAASVCAALAVGIMRLLWHKLYLIPREKPVKQTLIMEHGIYRGGLSKSLSMLLVIAGFCIGVFFIVRRLVRAFGSPDHVTQLFDNLYHINAIRHIAETQNGSALTIGNLTETSRAFYPAAMHDLFALVFQAGNVPLTASLYVCIIVFSALVWPIGAMFLISRIVGARPFPLAITGILAAGFSAYPYAPLSLGVLYSFFAAIAVLPTALGLVIEALGLTTRKQAHPVVPVFWLMLVLPGLALAHPSVFIAFLLFAVPLFTARTLRELITWRLRGGPRKPALTWLAYSFTFGIIFTILWIKIRPGDLVVWPAIQSTAQAIGEVIASAPSGAVAAWIVMFFTIVGVYVILRWQRDKWWVLFGYTIGAILHIFASSWGSGPLRTFLVGTWYHDPHRPLSFLPLVTLPVVIIGAEAVYRWILLRARGIYPKIRKEKNYRWFSASLAGVLCVITAVVSQAGTLTKVTNAITGANMLTAESALLTTDKNELLHKIGEYVPEDETIMVDPLTGASFAYAISDRKVLPPHVFGKRSDEEQYLIDHWYEAAFNPKVCEYIRDMKAYWMLDFGTQRFTNHLERYLGLRHASDDRTGKIEVVTQVGSMRLLHMKGCGSSQ